MPEVARFGIQGRKVPKLQKRERPWTRLVSTCYISRYVRRSPCVFSVCERNVLFPGRSDDEVTLVTRRTIVRREYSIHRLYFSLCPS